MHINKLIGISLGADVSRTPPIDRPSVYSPLSRFIKLSLLLCLLIFPLAGCDILPGVTVSVTPASTSSNGTQLNVWNRVASGVEVRYEDWKIPGGDDDTVHVWDTATGKLVITYHGHLFGVNTLAWSPDGKYIASGSNDNTVQVWEVATGDSIYTYRGHTAWVDALTWSPDGKRIASAGNDHTVRLWEAFTGQPLFVYRDHTDNVTTLAWSPDGSCIASAGTDRTVYIWRAV